MTEQQEKHLQDIKDHVCKLIDEKYRIGAAKHNSCLADMPFDQLMKELKFEIIDMMVYWAALEIRK